MYSTTFTAATAAKGYHEHESEAEAIAFAQRKANKLRLDVSVAWHGADGQREFVRIVRPEAKPRKLAIYRHMDTCLAAGMTIEEASHAWTVGDYRC